MALPFINPAGAGSTGATGDVPDKRARRGLEAPLGLSPASHSPVPLCLSPKMDCHELGTGRKIELPETRLPNDGIQRRRAMKTTLINRPNITRRDAMKGGIGAASLAAVGSGVALPTMLTAAQAQQPAASLTRVA